MSALIELENIRKSFGPVDVLKGVNMTIEPGKVSALVGDNGAGKSTLIKGLSGAQPYDEGEVRFEGTPVTIQTPLDASGLGIEVVYQDLALCENLDIVDPKGPEPGPDEVGHGAFVAWRIDAVAADQVLCERQDLVGSPVEPVEDGVVDVTHPRASRRTPQDRTAWPIRATPSSI